MNSRTSWKWLVALGAVFVPSTLLAALTLPNSFSAGSPILSAEVNENFSAIKTFVDGLETNKQDRPASGEFTATAEGNIAYAWVSSTCATNTTADCALSADFARNPVGAAPTSTRTATGRYTVTFPDLGSSTGGHVQVTAYGGGSVLAPPSSNYCVVVRWTQTTVDVACFNASGTAADSAFTVMYIR